MKRFFIFAGIAVAAGALSVPQAGGQQGSGDNSRSVLDQYCVTCHNDRLKTGSLTLQSLDLGRVDADAASLETWEKVVRKIRSGMMPPAGAPRPERAQLDAFVSGLETSLDRVAAANPNPGTPRLHRMNRNEYANAIRDLIALDIDPTLLFPPDSTSEGFDNVADVLGVSPALMERYVAAAAKISRLAVGNPSTGAAVTTYRVPVDRTQLDHIESLPIGTRGGILIRHNFPLDAEYLFKMAMLSTNIGGIYGFMTENETLEFTINGERVALLEVTKQSGVEPLELQIPVRAGPQAIGIAFLKKSAFAAEDIFQPFDRTTLDTFVGIQQEYETLPHLARVSITGPFDATGPGDTPSRNRIFTCRPGAARDEIPCARDILSELARRAFRRPVVDADLEDLLGYYQAGRNDGDFERGIEMALRRLLADPEFLFRFERDPEQVATGVAHRISDVELASRLSFFLWSSIPDDELLGVASQERLHEPAVLTEQVRRMLADPRSRALVDNFASQWLYLRNLKSVSPDPRIFPDFDDNLRQAFLQETEMLFGSILREDRNVFDLLNADYTFVNERLAEHYGIDGVIGSRFRRVAVADETRRGFLGQGSFLMVTSNANRTNPVSRGKWVLENILGSPPPLPPANVPPLKEDGEPGGDISVRQRMELHRSNPVCASCHKIMDPIGLSLENFDAVGRWRDKDLGTVIDATTQLVDGTPVLGPASLREALLNYPEAFVRTFAEKLMTYGLGRKLEAYDMPVVRSITREAAGNDYRFSSLVLGIVNSDAFQMRVKLAPEAAQTAGIN